MKVGAEVTFLAGQIFMVGVAAVAVLPRVPSDTLSSSSRVGGRLSHPFRRALVWLVVIGFIRNVSCHLWLAMSHMTKGTEATAGSSSLLTIADAILGTLQVAGQNFLCLTTAYLLQCQLATVINIEGGRPGKSLMPYLTAIFVLTVLGSLLSAFVHSYWFFLVNMAEALSCRPVIQTLQTYARLSTATASTTTTTNTRQQEGPILVQALLVVEYWFFTTSVLSCLAEFIAIGTTDQNHETDEVEITNTTNFLWFAIQLLLQAIRSNQDTGIDDWTRLLLHSVFLNSLDELEHFTGGISSSRGGVSTTTASSNDAESGGIEKQTQLIVPAMGLRQRP